MKRNARIAWALMGLGAVVGVYGISHRHALLARVRDAYHNYKDAQFQAAMAKYELRERAEAPLVIYDDALGAGWRDWSWVKHDLHWTQDVHQGSAAIQITPAAWKGLYLQHDPVSLLGYGTLEMYVRGSARLDVCLADGRGKFGKKLDLQSYCRPDLAGWSVARIPLSDFEIAAHGAKISGLIVQARDVAEPPLLLDQISLLPDMSLPPAPTRATVAATVDLTAAGRPISPLIYGMAFAPPEYLKDLRLGINRWGGNDKSRYNWANGNAVNAARDWQWRNRPASGAPLAPAPSSAADDFTRKNRSAGAETLLTVPTIGWVAADSNTSHLSVGVPSSGAAPLDSADGAIAGYDPSGNRELTSVPSKARKGRPFSDPPDAGAVYQDEWISHLTHTFGDAAHGGVRFYAMDNEPDLWDNTHTDVHPARMGYDDLLGRFLQYADAVKDVDPSARVTGPVSWGWTGYIYSPLDRGDDNFRSHADSDAHGGGPFIPWFLRQVRAHDLKTGRRSLDVLDIHYYPQASGMGSSGHDKDTQARRLRAVRSMWDPDYLDESWIKEKIMLIPRMKTWVAQNYPGVQIGLTEWNFGADRTINGGLAVGDALGVFGREGLDMACYWAYPRPGTAGYFAFKMYRNADGAGHGFGDLSVPARSADSDRLSVYGATDSATGDVTVMLINKMPKATVTAPLELRGLSPGAHAMRCWRMAIGSARTPDPKWTHAQLWNFHQLGDPARLDALPTQRIDNGRASVILPPYSLTLLRIAPDKK